MSTLQTLRLFFRMARPWLLLGVALLYALGASVTRYLDGTINWQLYFLGQAWITLLQVSTHALADYFTLPGPRPTQEPLLSEYSGALEKDKLPRSAALWLSMACLAMLAPLTVLILQVVGLQFPILINLTLIFVVALLFAAPPTRLVTSGYGELTIAVLVAALTPTLAFLLQRGEPHRLLTMTTFPIFALMLAMLLVFNLPGYASDIKLSRSTLMVRLGWERGMLLHNYLILFAFLLIGLAPLLGFPTRIMYPALLALPLGLYQIWQIRLITEGNKPNWKSLIITAAASTLVTCYLMLFAYWSN